MKVKIIIVALLAVAALLSVNAEESGKKYEANWASLDTRPMPQWWVDAKFGIFVHWGPYSVPAFAPTDAKEFWLCYAEWYQGQCLRTNAAFCAHHQKHYGNRPYANFAAEFTAENFRPDRWAALFKKAGARYAVLTAKHHDGYALWPSPETPYYNSVALGSGRDLVGEFATAMRAAGLKCGFYYSLMEYANPLFPATVAGKSAYGPEALSTKEWAACVNVPQLKELVERYRADIVWPDGEWGWPSSEFRSEEFLSWLYNESSMRTNVVVNDRWGADCRGRHGGHFTSEYGTVCDDLKTKTAVVQHPWEECRGIGKSFGYNRYETVADYLTPDACVELLVDVVSRGGNLLLNVGPTADGRIPVIMQDRLLAIGHWLEINGEAIYGTTRWEEADPDLRKQGIYFTRRGLSIYLIATQWPKSAIVIPRIMPVDNVSFLGLDSRIEWTQSGDVLRVVFPRISATSLPSTDAWTVRIDLVGDANAVDSSRHRMISSSEIQNLCDSK